MILYQIESKIIILDINLRIFNQPMNMLKFSLKVIKYLFMIHSNHLGLSLLVRIKKDMIVL